MPLFVKLGADEIVQVPLSMVVVPLLVKVRGPLKALVGLAPKGTVQPEEMTIAPPESLVIIILVKVTEPQVRVVSSPVLMSVKVVVKPEGKVPEAIFKFPIKDIVLPA